MLWLNLGDSYAGSGKGCNGDGTLGTINSVKQKSNRGTMANLPGDVPSGLKPKDLIGIPWRVAFALQADGWWLRSDCIWHKPNPMPESVTDRPTKSHEYIFLLSKSASYYYDAEAVKEKLNYPNETRRPLGSQGAWEMDGRKRGENGGGKSYDGYPSGRNLRSVWTFPTTPCKEAHFAVFPEALPRRCIMAGTSERGVCPKCGKAWERISEKSVLPPDDRVNNNTFKHDAMTTHGEGATTLRNRVVSSTVNWQPSCECGVEPIGATVLDPFMGAGTTGLVAVKLGRSFCGIELNPEYLKIAERRIANAAGLFDQGGRATPFMPGRVEKWKA